MQARQPGQSRLLPPNSGIPLDMKPPGQRTRPRTMLMAGPNRMRGIRVQTLRTSSKGGGAPIHVSRTGGPRTSTPFWDGPSRTQPHCLPGAVVGAGKAGKPAKPKAKRAPGRPASQRARKSGALQEPSGNPKGHIQHWLARGVTGVSTAPDGTRQLPGKPQNQAPENCRSVSGCGTGLQPGSWRPLVVLGSSTDPPPDCIRSGAGDFSTPTPGAQGAGLGGPQAARRARPDCGRGSREHQGSGAWSPPREAGNCLGAGIFSDDEGTPPRVRFIPDLFAPFPRGGGRQVLPRLGGRGTGQLERD